MTAESDNDDPALMERYRQASREEGAAPSSLTREAILAEGRRVAAERLTAQRPASQPPVTKRRAPHRPRWWLTVAGSLAVAGVAAFLVLPRVWEPSPRDLAAVSVPPPAVPPPSAPPPAAAPADADRLQARNAIAQTQRVPRVPAPRAAEAPPSAVPSAASSAGAAVKAPPAYADTLTAAREDAVAPIGGVSRRDASLSSAVAAGNLRQAAELLDNGADSRLPDPSGRTPLLLAVIEQRPDLVRLLLAHGADPNARDRSGESPLERARRDGRADIVSLLEAAGAR